MGVNRRYKVLIVEDDETYASELQVCLNRTQDFGVIAVTDSADRAFEYIKTGLPDVIVVDLQLREGDGLELMSRVRDPGEKLPMQPYILVTTNVTSNRTISKINNGLADFVYLKQMVGYSPEHILKHLRLMADEFDCNKEPAPQPSESPLEKEERIRSRVISELDNYYINHGTAAKDFLIEAICMVLALPENEKPLVTKRIFPAIGKKYSKDWHAVDMGITRLIQSAFTKTAEKDLERIYKPYVDIGRGAPSNKEFIIYIANKIREENL